MRDYMANYRERRRTQAKALLGGKCALCASTEDLQFDHRDPTTKERNISAMWTCSEVRFLAELEKCQLLCLPCHQAKSANEATARSKQVHGTQWSYRHYKCRCPQCRAAHAAVARKSRSIPMG